MYQIRQTVADMENEENRLLTIHTADSNASANSMGFTFAGLVLLNLVLLAPVYYLIRRDINARKRTDKQIRELKEDPEKRVAERTE